MCSLGSRWVPTFEEEHGGEWEGVGTSGEDLCLGEVGLSRAVRVGGRGHHVRGAESSCRRGLEGVLSEPAGLQAAGGCARAETSHSGT